MIGLADFNRGLADSTNRFNAADASGNRVVGTLGKMVIGLGAVGIASSALRSILATTREFEGTVDRVTAGVETAKLKLQIQAGQGNAEAARQEIGTIRRVLNDLPATDLEGAIARQTELTSVGFPERDVRSGDALRELLKVQVGTGEFGPGASSEKAKELIGASAAVLKSGGDELSADSLGRVSSKFVSLFRGTPVQSADLPALAEATAVMNSRGIDEDERFGAFATSKSLLGAQKGATALKQMSNFLRATTGKSDQLGDDFGLNTSGFDLIGEGLADSLEDLTRQLSQLSEQKRSQAVEKIFGKEAGANFETLAPSVADMRKNTQTARQGGVLGENVRIFQQSESAKRIRARNQTEFAVLDLDEKRGNLSFAEIRENEKLAEARGQLRADNPLERTASSMESTIRSGTISLSESIGIDPEYVQEGLSNFRIGSVLSPFKRQRPTAETASPNRPPLVNDSGASAIVQGIQQLLDTANRQLEVLEQRKDASDNMPFIPEAGTAPHDTVLLSREHSR